MKNELEKIIKKLNDINYGFIDKDNNVYPYDSDNWDKSFGKLYHLQSPKELIESKYGVCWDQVELERFYLKEKNIESKSFFIIAHDQKQEPTHTFIVIKKDKYYWLEHSWEPHRGIHEYKTLNELLIDVRNKFIDSIKKYNVDNYDIDIYEYKKPKYNISCIEFMEHCEKGKKIKNIDFKI